MRTYVPAWGDICPSGSATGFRGGVGHDAGHVALHRQRRGRTRRLLHGAEATSGGSVGPGGGGSGKVAASGAMGVVEGGVVTPEHWLVYRQMVRPGRSRIQDLPHTSRPSAGVRVEPSCDASAPTVSLYGLRAAAVGVAAGLPTDGGFRRQAQASRWRVYADIGGFNRTCEDVVRGWHRPWSAFGRRHRCPVLVGVPRRVGQLMLRCRVSPGQSESCVMRQLVCCTTLFPPA